jgi:hypothetical protein
VKCSACGREESAEALVCALCGEVLRKKPAGHFLEIEEGDQGREVKGPEVKPAARAVMTAWSPAVGKVEEPRKHAWLTHPAAALAMGLLFFPLAKVLWLPNYMFNFLTTLVHEIGHAACALLMGRFAIPAVSLGGGGITQWTDPPATMACLMAWAGLGYLAWLVRGHKGLMITTIVACAVYPLLAFTSANQLFAIAGGVLFEIVGATYCFVRTLTPHLDRPIERPLYALVGWWMLLNRGSETILMLKDESYWATQAVYESGLAAGMTSDLEVLRESLAVTPYPILWVVLMLCIAALPAAVFISWFIRRLLAHP